MLLVAFALLMSATAQTGGGGGSPFARVGDTVWLEGKAGHNTSAIRALEPRTELVFVETAHFRVGCSLKEARLPTDSKDRRRVLDELEALRRLSVSVPKAPKQIDCALLAHLYALRLERLYEDMSRRLGVSDADFPKEPPVRRDESYMGEGPFMGARQRFLVLLCESESTLVRYCEVFAKRATAQCGVRHFFLGEGAFLFGVAMQGPHMGFESDRSLHAGVAFGVTHNLVDAFKYNWHETPFWLQEGLAHWQRRCIDDEIDHFTFLPKGLPEKNRQIDWPTSVRARTALGNFTPMRAVLPWLADLQIEFGDHLAIWSRVDFLLRRHPAAFGRLVRAIKGPEPNGTYTPKAERLIERQVNALQSILGWTPEEFDRAWVAFVQQTYPKQ